MDEEEYTKLPDDKLIVKKFMKPEHAPLIDELLRLRRSEKEELKREREKEELKREREKEELKREKEKEELKREMEKEKEMQFQLELAKAQPPSYVNLFREKLAKSYITRPEESIIDKIIKKYPYDLILASGSDDATLELYLRIKDLPSTITKFILSTEDQLHVNGPIDLSRDYLLSAADEQGKQYVIKLLIPGNDDVRELSIRQTELRKELEAVKRLELHNPQAPFVTCEVISFTRSNSHIATALKIPRYIVTVASAPKFFPQGLASGGKRMIEALEWMHKKDVVHMDVKGDNIFIDSNGDWFLGDFGSCKSAGENITSTTAAFYYENITGRVAEFRYDWYMLLVTIVIETLEKKDDFRELCSDKSGISRVDDDKIKIAVDKIPSASPLRLVIDTIMTKINSRP